jgi:hypothetical protein
VGVLRAMSDGRLESVIVLSLDTFCFTGVKSGVPLVIGSMTCIGRQCLECNALPSVTIDFLNENS